MTEPRKKCVRRTNIREGYTRTEVCARIRAQHRVAMDVVYKSNVSDMFLWVVCKVLILLCMCFFLFVETEMCGGSYECIVGKDFFNIICLRWV